MLSLRERNLLGLNIDFAVMKEKQETLLELLKSELITNLVFMYSNFILRETTEFNQ